MKAQQDVAERRVFGMFTGRKILSVSRTGGMKRGIQANSLGEFHDEQSLRTGRGIHAATLASSGRLLRVANANGVTADPIV